MYVACMHFYIYVCMHVDYVNNSLTVSSSIDQQRLKGIRKDIIMVKADMIAMMNTDIQIVLALFTGSTFFSFSTFALSNLNFEECIICCRTRVRQLPLGTNSWPMGINTVTPLSYTIDHMG